MVVRGNAAERQHTPGIAIAARPDFASTMSGPRTSRRPHSDPPYRPQANGKAERFIGTLVREWACSLPEGA